MTPLIGNPKFPLGIQATTFYSLLKLWQILPEILSDGCKFELYLKNTSISLTDPLLHNYYMSFSYPGFLGKSTLTTPDRPVFRPCFTLTSPVLFPWISHSPQPIYHTSPSGKRDLWTSHRAEKRNVFNNLLKLSISRNIWLSDPTTLVHNPKTLRQNSLTVLSPLLEMPTHISGTDQC